ncbi:hypothetical protein AB0H88_51890 [Nonomuraea sp. NPDC050680]|uniref:hypothetical protein n=1 Tax=Nonomuraea sp. NPDC050680 TaxID=3154630 RepID=UPI003404CDB1
MGPPDAVRKTMEPPCNWYDPRAVGDVVPAGPFRRRSREFGQQVQGVSGARQ